MDQFKHVFNTPTIHQTLFFDIITITEYSDVNKFIEKDAIGFKNWSELAVKKYGEADNHSYMTNTQYLPEYAKIHTLAFGGFNIVDGEEKKFLVVLDDVNEKELLEKFFTYLNRFQNKHLDGYLCGFNISNFHIPFLIKRGLRHGLPIPKMLKHNLMAKPWENSIIDVMELWKLMGYEAVTLNSVSHFLGLNNENKIDLCRFNTDYWTNSIIDVNINIRLGTIIKIYLQLRKM